MRMNMENFISFLGVLPLLARCDFHALAYSVRFTILRLRKMRDFMYFSFFSPQSSPKGNSYIFCFPRIPMAPSKKKGVCCPVAQCLLQLLTFHLCSHVRTRNIIQYSMNTYPICDSPLYRDWRGAQLRPRVFSPKSPFLHVCVNRSRIWYGFRSSAEAVRFSVNITSVWLNVSFQSR